MPADEPSSRNMGIILLAVLGLLGAAYLATSLLISLNRVIRPRLSETAAPAMVLELLPMFPEGLRP
jgi:hypothetical protein